MINLLLNFKKKKERENIIINYFQTKKETTIESNWTCVCKKVALFFKFQEVWNEKSKSQITM
jgi:hypothetical protein